MKRRLFNLPFGPELELGPDLPIPRPVWRGLTALMLVLVPVANWVTRQAEVLAEAPRQPAAVDPVERDALCAGSARTTRL